MPDVICFGAEKSATLQPEQLRLPVPDFACEILSDATAKLDRGVKFRDYEAHGIGEHWLVDPDAETLEQFLLRDGAYALEVKSGSGTVRSRTVAGFEIPIRAMFDAAGNLAALKALLAAGS